MGKMLLGLAAIAAIGLAAPAAAGTPEEPFVGIPDAKGTLGTFAGNGGVQVGGFVDQRSGRRSSGNGSGGIWVNGGEWARYNNQTFQSDGFNDWWHDRPDRAYPAWMRNNQDCAKQWYAGSTLRC